MPVQIGVQVFAFAAQLTILFGSKGRQRVLDIPYPAVNTGAVDPEDIGYLIRAVVALIIENSAALLFIGAMFHSPVL